MQSAGEETLSYMSSGKFECSPRIGERELTSIHVGRRGERAMTRCTAPLIQPPAASMSGVFKLS